YKNYAVASGWGSEGSIQSGDPCTFVWVQAERNPQWASGEPKIIVAALDPPGDWTPTYQYNLLLYSWDGSTLTEEVEATADTGISLYKCFDIKFNKVALSSSAYKMDIEFNTTSVPSSVNYYLQLNYSVDGSETDFGVLVYDGISEVWDDLSSQGDLTSTSFTTKEYTLESSQVLGSGYVRVRFIGRNETSDSVNSTLNIEYHRIACMDDSLTFQGETAGDLFGWSVANASDIDDDGLYDDVIVGAPGYSSDKGRAYIYFGSSYTYVSSNATIYGVISNFT
ncbi:unnamed protein product, partial [marine sediment metagenome]